MYRILDKTQNQLKEFSSKDSLLLDLERENNRFTATGSFSSFLLTAVDKKGQVLGEAEFTMPKRDKDELYAEIESILESFATKSDTNQSSSHPVEPEEVAQNQTKKKKDKQSAPKEAESPSKSRLWVSLVKWALIGLSLVLSAMSFFLALKLKSSVLTPKISEVEVKSAFVQDDHAVDVFSRYFLGAYYGQSKNLSQFLSEEVEAADFKVDGSIQPVSTLLEEVSKKDKKITVTYVLALKDKEETTTKRVTFQLVEDKKSEYGYQVTSKLEFSKYPK